MPCGGASHGALRYIHLFKCAYIYSVVCTNSTNITTYKYRRARVCRHHPAQVQRLGHPRHSLQRHVAARITPHPGLLYLSMHAERYTAWFVCIHEARAMTRARVHTQRSSVGLGPACGGANCDAPRSCRVGMGRSPHISISLAISISRVWQYFLCVIMRHVICVGEKG
jgi:hypothetical protein